jgi:site-specific recombinase XerD
MMISREKLLEDYRSFMVLKNFSPRTIKTYVSILDYFFRYCEKYFPEDELNDDLVRKYLLKRFDDGWSWQTVNSDYSAIQKFFKNVVFLEWSLKKLPRPRKQKPLPTIFSKEDIVKIIESAPSFKQQILLTFIYVTGARLSETVNMKLDDIDGNRCQIRINGGKGAKDRLILVPGEFIHTLRQYYKKVRPEVYLFNGAFKGIPYAPRTLQYTLQQAKRRARITKKGSIHTLRNCYATHHLENGTDLVFLQEQMGHKNLRTTISYIGLCVERQRYINHPILSLSIKYRV